MSVYPVSIIERDACQFWSPQFHRSIVKGLRRIIVGSNPKVENPVIVVRRNECHEAGNQHVALEFPMTAKDLNHKYMVVAIMLAR